MTKLRTSLYLLLAVAVLVAAPVSLAQMTGSITGIVKDSSGGPLPGVSVEVRGPSLQGTKTSVTTANGSFRIPLVPPGEYTVTFSLSGFSKLEKKAAVSLDKVATVDVTMVLSMKSEEIIVTGEAPVVDSTDSASGASFTSEFAKTLPLGRNFTAVATKVPGVIQGFGADALNFNVYGSTGAENNFVVDGMDTTEVRYGRSGKSVSQEFVAEVEVKAGGFQAEYGHAQGGVINAITKSGGNEFHGSAFGYYSGRPDSADGGNVWTASDKNLQNKLDSQGTFRTQADFVRNTRTWDAGAGIGGFFVKDLLWFYGGYDKVKIDRETFLSSPTAGCAPAPAPCPAPGTGRLNGQSIPLNTDQDLYNAKLTIRATDWLSFVGSIVGDPRTDSPNLGTPIAGADIGTYAGDRTFGGMDYMGRVQGVLGSVGLFEFQASKHQEEDKQAPTNTADKLFLPTRPAGLPRTGGFGFNVQTEFVRNFFRGSVSYFAKFAGSHEFKAGADYMDVRSDNANQYTGPAGNKETLFTYVVYDPVTHLPTTIYQHEYNSTGNRNAAGDPIEADANSTVSRSNNTAYFIQDKWQIIPSLTLNVGLRYEDQKVKGRDGNTEIHVANEVMPRLGFAWDFLGNGKSRVFGNYARFYQTMPTDINIRAYGLEITTAVYNFDPNSSHGEASACGPVWASSPTADPGLQICAPGRHSTIKTGGSFGEPTQPGIKGQFNDEYSFGVELEPVTNLSVSAKYIYRSLGRVIEDGASLNAAGDLEYFIFNPGDTFISPVSGALVGTDYVDVPPRRFYRAVQFSAQKRFNNQLQFLASYTWSKLEGNYDGVFQTSTTQLDPNINSAYDYRVFLDNAYGFLSNDRRSTFKVDGSYVTKFGLTAGLSMYYFTGTPITQHGYYNDYRNYELYLTQRGTVGRTDDVYDADLHLGYDFKAGPTTINLGLDIFSLFNTQRTLQVDERYDSSQGGPQQANYLQPIAFTPKRSLRVAARVSF